MLPTLAKGGCTRFIERFKRRMHPRRLPSNKHLKRLMGDVKLYIADVGSSGGPESRWRDCVRFCHFLAFDPDPRGGPAESDLPNTNFNVGLWSCQTERLLFQTAFQPASSVFEMNSAINDDFLYAPGFRIVDTQPIKLEAMASVVPDELAPDFIKVDAQGADLEILRGSAKFLQTTCLGVQVEVLFIKMYKNAPLFSDLDPYVRSFGFSLFSLLREHGIRSNGKIGLTSRPQIIYANAIYFLDWAHFSDRMASAAPAIRDRLFKKFILLLLVYRAHDYAVEITDRSHSAGWVTDECAKLARDLVRLAISSPLVLFTKALIYTFPALAAFVVLCPFASLRRRAWALVKYRMRKIIMLPLALASRGGLNRECITDDDD